MALHDREISCNPFYPSARVEIIFYYSSSGNTDTFEDCKDDKPLVAYFEKSGMVICGRSELTDATKGIISLKAYRKHLAEEIVKNIIQQLPSQTGCFAMEAAQHCKKVFAIDVSPTMREFAQQKARMMGLTNI